MSTRQSKSNNRGKETAASTSQNNIYLECIQTEQKLKKKKKSPESDTQLCAGQTQEHSNNLVTLVWYIVALIWYILCWWSAWDFQVELNGKQSKKKNKIFGNWSVFASVHLKIFSFSKEHLDTHTHTHTHTLRISKSTWQLRVCQSIGFILFLFHFLKKNTSPFFSSPPFVKKKNILWNCTFSTYSQCMHRPIAKSGARAYSLTRCRCFTKARQLTCSPIDF